MSHPSGFTETWSDGIGEGVTIEKLNNESERHVMRELWDSAMTSTYNNDAEWISIFSV
jgi:hypothetical protein